MDKVMNAEEKVNPRNAGNAKNFAPDVGIVNQYLDLLGIAPDDNIRVETIDNVVLDGEKRKNKELKRQKNIKRSELPKRLEWLARMQERGAGVYVFPQMHDGIGRETENVTGIRALFCELDNGMPERGFPIEPTFIVETSPNRFHVYWLCDGLTFEDFEGIMPRLVAEYGHDKSAQDRTRLLRLPGTWNVKVADKPHLVRIVADGGRRYSRDEITKAFPPIERRQAKSNSSKALFNKLHLIDGDEERRIREVAEFLHDKTGGQEWSERASWLQWGMALHEATAGGEQGFALWSELSAQYAPAKFKPTGQTEAWQSFGDGKSNGTVTMGSIFHRAKELGWKPPKRTSSKANGEAAIGADGSVTTKQDDIAEFLKRRGVTVYRDEFAGKDMIEGYPGFTELTDEAVRKLWFEAEREGLRVRKDYFFDAVLDLAMRDLRHPVRVYLDRVQPTWDRIARVDDWLIRYAGAADTPLNRAIGKLFLVGAVRRVRQPGVKFDTALLLQGPQGAGKSTMARILASDAWFDDSLNIGMNSQEVIELTRGKWIVEDAEFRGDTRDMESIKAMISRQVDTARMAYGRTVSSISRQFVIVISTNKDEVFRDLTGNRRFLPVEVGRMDLEALRRDKDALWAEAAVLEEAGEGVELPEDLRPEAARLQAERLVSDGYDDLVAEKLDDLNGELSLDEVLDKLGLMDDDRRRTDDRFRQGIGRAMQRQGWKKVRKMDGGVRKYRYVKAAPAPIGQVFEFYPQDPAYPQEVRDDWEKATNVVVMAKGRRRGAVSSR